MDPTPTNPNEPIASIPATPVMPPSSTLTPPASTTMGEIDPLKLQDFIQRRRAQQNLGLGILGGFVGATLGAILWAAITAGTKYQIGWMAIGVGFLTGFGVRYLGKGMDKVFGVVGAVFALAGCVLGNILAPIIMVSSERHIPFGAIVAHLSVDTVWDILVKTFSPLDLLFYGFAIYFGYRYSFHAITPAEIETLKSQSP